MNTERAKVVLSCPKNCIAKILINVEGSKVGIYMRLAFVLAGSEAENTFMPDFLAIIAKTVHVCSARRGILVTRGKLRICS